jgi:hypothetical protein
VGLGSRIVFGVADPKRNETTAIGRLNPSVGIVDHIAFSRFEVKGFRR